MIAIGAILLAAGLGQSAPPPPSSEAVAGILVQGNHVTPDADVIRLSGLVIGEVLTDRTLADAHARLDATHLFERVDVLKRYASIADLSRILVVIVVDEGAVGLARTGGAGAPVRVVRRRGLAAHLMFFPILEGEDGYGVTYGVQAADVGIAGDRSRLSFPLTWGGTKQAAAELERTFTTGPLTRIDGGAGVERQRNPAFDIDDDRTGVWADAERRAGPILAAAHTKREHVSFGDLDDDVTSFGGDVSYDTRVDPTFPREAVYLSAGWTSFHFASGGTTQRTRLEGQGYLGLAGQTVLVLRAVREEADAPLPPYLKTLVGGASSLRGFRAGAFAGDTAVTGSIELRVPLSSPLDVSRFGVSVFTDAGTAYDKGQRLSGQPIHLGAGAGVWCTAAVLHLGVSVAHGYRATTRVNFEGGLDF